MIVKCLIACQVRRMEMSSKVVPSSLVVNRETASWKTRTKTVSRKSPLVKKWIKSGKKNRFAKCFQIKIATTVVIMIE